MNILLAGASGYVGPEVTKALIAHDHEVTAILHSTKGAQSFRADFPQVKTVTADVTDQASCAQLDAQITHHDAIVYLPGLLREFPAKGITFRGIHVEGVRNLIELAKRIGVQRWIQMSALGAAANSTTGYFTTKWQAEQLVRASGLDWTIVRPSVIFGEEPSAKMNFVGELANALKLAPFLPIFGDGKYRMQPIAVRVVASTIVQALDDPKTIGRSYDLGGPEQIEYTEILRSIAQAMGKSKPAVHIPFFLVEAVATLFDRYKFFPLTRDQLTMLKLENIVHDAEREREFIETFHPVPITLRDGLRGYFGAAAKHKT